MIISLIDNNGAGNNNDNDNDNDDNINTYDDINT